MVSPDWWTLTHDSAGPPCICEIVVLCVGMFLSYLCSVFQDGLPYSRRIERVITFVEFPDFLNLDSLPYCSNSMVFYFNDMLGGFEICLVSRVDVIHE